MHDPNTFQSIGWVLLALAGLAGALNQGLALLDRFKERPSAAEVASEAREKFVPMAAHVEFATNLVRRIEQVERTREEDARAAGLSRKNIYDEIHAQAKRTEDALIGIRTEMGSMERRLSTEDENRTLKLHDRLNDILAEVGEIRGELKHTT